MSAGHPNAASPLSLRNVPFAIHVGGADTAYDRNLKAMEWGTRLEMLAATDPGGYLNPMASSRRSTALDGAGRRRQHSVLAEPRAQSDSAPHRLGTSRRHARAARTLEERSDPSMLFPGEVSVDIP
jgi:hypothetical protein